MFSLEEILKAYLSCRKNKRNTINAEQKIIESLSPNTTITELNKAMNIKLE